MSDLIWQQVSRALSQPSHSFSLEKFGINCSSASAGLLAPSDWKSWTLKGLRLQVQGTVDSVEHCAKDCSVERFCGCSDEIEVEVSG